MKILAIDTSSKNCSVSITEAEENDFKVIAEKNNEDEKTHSQKLMPLIDEMFKETKLFISDIDILVCCVGPGSFTGIRIGVATTKAFADVRNVPTIGVTSLESLSYNVNKNGYIIPIINAKNNNAYSAVFKLENGNYTMEQESVADSIDVILENFSKFIEAQSKNEEITFVGDGVEVYKEKILQKFNKFNINFCENNIQSSISLAKCGYDKYKKGIFGDSNFISPIYLRKSQAERNANGEK